MYHSGIPQNEVYQAYQILLTAGSNTSGTASEKAQITTSYQSWEPNSGQATTCTCTWSNLNYKGYHTASPSHSRSIHLSWQMLHCIRLQRRPVSTIAHDVSLSSTEDSGYCQVYPSRDTAVGWPQTPGSSWR